MYKTNYDLYKCESIDSRRTPPPPDELLSPLATLYPHVAAMHYNSTFTGYRNTDYWAVAYPSQPIEEPLSPRRTNDLPCRFVSKLRRLLSRDDLKYRRRSESTT
ncbi:uncharacterized protein N7483_007701 [Penicillium malachiteum]|uniref:uncharacterized protein n=1 Tax=Penicillium malachiteum TaxID=1324776 RepID=UPI0025467A25|nr:uncharacterized protein N7483_007701 [Penicillium malachiteum]KAJ5726344.1 hypothetical protein N7483_007701 [Penicillium malachiteum]